MNKTFAKLMAISVSTVITLVIVVASSYAWLNMSTAPSVAGLQINIGSKNTILIAPDIQRSVDGATVHYPGAFSETLNFSRANGYDYVQELVPLSPVSTADGIHWYFPRYTESGQTSEEEPYLADATLQYGNATVLPDDDAVSGGYAYVDFWIVSPSRCNLRVSAGDGDGGSYMVGLPYPTEDENGEYTLDFSAERLADYARVGFLVNDQKITDSSMNEYVHSDVYNEHYSKLKGVYQEKGAEWNSYPARFTIYEPNADSHGEDGAYLLSKDGLEYVHCPDGGYAATYPLGEVNGVVEPVDVSTRVTAQRSTEWLKANDTEYRLEQMFGTYLYGTSETDMYKLADEFYRGYLGYQCGTLLDKGAFIENTDNLMRAADKNGVVAPQTLDQLSTAGATDDVVIIELEKNVPQRIRMFVWIEGQDVDCTANKTSGGLLLNLELAGSGS